MGMHVPLTTHQISAIDQMISYVGYDELVLSFLSLFRYWSGIYSCMQSRRKAIDGVSFHMARLYYGGLWPSPVVSSALRTCELP
jgi:hypothetical protein